MIGQTTSAAGTILNLFDLVELANQAAGVSGPCVGDDAPDAPLWRAGPSVGDDNSPPTYEPLGPSVGDDADPS